MTGEIALLLGQDGLTNGAIYALLALALVLVYTVTRIVYVAQGEFVTYGAMTLATLQLGAVPGTVWLVLALGICAAGMEAWPALRDRRGARLLRVVVVYIGLPLALLALSSWLAPLKPPLFIQILLTLAAVVPLGPLIYRVAFQPIANASVLVLLIVSVAVQFALVGLALLAFGAEGARTEPLSDGLLAIGVMTVTGQSLWVLGASVALIVALYLFFERTVYGKALRATAVNRIGARIVGIRTETAGRLCLTLAAAIGAISGILISPLTTMYYDSGFLIGLKGFVAAIVGGMVSYPIAAAGAILVGLLEAFSSFWASAFKEVIVFTLIIPVLLWRSFSSVRVEGEDE
jgi:branched-chain amino acid transport system permease protein